MPPPESIDEEFAYEVPPGVDRERADKVLTRAFPQFSRAQFQRFFDAGRVWCESEAILKKQKVSAGDLLAFTVPPVAPAELRPVEIPLRVAYEDEHLVVVDKAPGMVVHPGAGSGEDTLVHALLHHCAGALSGIGGVGRPGIVHRLDRYTSGLIVAAKSDAAFAGLANAFAERRVEKVYLALVAGVPELLSGSVKEPLGRHRTNRLKRAVDPAGRPAHSDWKRLRAFGGDAALLEVRIHTGRTHQIRVHLSHLGHPIIGDQLYGYRPRGSLPDTAPRVLLHAHRLGFEHPVTREPMRLEVPVPSDFEAAIAAQETE